MKQTLYALTMTFLLASCGSETTPSTLSESEKKQFTISDSYIEEVETPTLIVNQIMQDNMMLDTSSTSEVGVIIDAIVNTGKKIWKIIEDNQSVVNIKYHYANALPKGISSASELENFSKLQYRTFRMWGKNGFGMTAYDVTYTLVHQHGGSYQGNGQFLSTVAIIPTSVDVLWGFDLDFETTEVSVTNAGSHLDPIAALTMEMAFKVSTIISKHTETRVAHFRGDQSVATLF